MRKRLGIFGASEETLRLVELLAANPEVVVAHFWADDREDALRRARAIGPALAGELEGLLTDDTGAFEGDDDLHAVIEAGGSARFREACPTAVDRGVQIVTPLTARLLWGYGVSARERKTELLQALAEVVESVDLTVDSDELFARMLEIAVGVTGADGGSLMLLDPDARELRIRVAIGVEPELWTKIRVPLGDGIAGRVAADARPLRLRGRADHQAFHIVRERLDVESALCVPLVGAGVVLGVLNLHHSTRPEAFSDDDFAFMQELAVLDAQIISRAQEHESLRNQAARYDAVRRVHELLGGPDPLPDRLRELCQLIAARVGGGIATVYLLDPDEGELRLWATSLQGGGFGGEYRIVSGQGIDGQVAESRSPAFLRRDDGTLAYVAIPLLAGERLVGVLSVQAGARPPRGRAVEETLLEMAAAVAEGIAQADREARMSMRATRASAINETGIRMISASQMTEVARLATSSAAMILEADHAVLRLQDDQSRRYVIRSYFGAADGPMQERLFRLDKRVSVEAIKRRQAMLVRDLATDHELSPHAAELRSVLAAPLKRDGRVVGTLSIYDKTRADRFYAGRFNDDDFQIFTRFVSYVERAVENAHLHSQARQHRNFDDETGLPNESYLGKRVQEEIARSAGRDGSLALAVCRIENMQEIAQQVNGAHAHRVLLATADAIRAHVRDFDVPGRTGEAEFTVLMPDPGMSPGERVFELARAVADAISKDEVLNEPVRVALAFGYAVYPNDGTDRDALLERAGDARIRMV